LGIKGSGGIVDHRDRERGRKRTERREERGQREEGMSLFAVS